MPGGPQQVVVAGQALVALAAGCVDGRLVSVERRLVTQPPVGVVGRTVVEPRQVGEVDVVAADAPEATTG
jgi:hypothetical protein